MIGGHTWLGSNFRALLCALAQSACGPNAANDDASAGEGGEGPGGASEQACPQTNETIDPTALVDDMEDQDAMIALVPQRGGAWWTAGDSTPGALIVPEPTALTDVLAAPEAIPGGRCGSSFAERVTGQGFNDWGAMLGLSFGWGTLANGEEGDLPYDATRWQGVEFWARIGDTSTNLMRFAVSDSNSEPAGGVCEVDGDVGELCYDSFGIYLNSLDVVWHHYRIPFAGLSRRDFGYPADAPALDAVYTLQFNFDPGAVFDFWVDDISFY